MTQTYWKRMAATFCRRQRQEGRKWWTKLGALNMCNLASTQFVKSLDAEGYTVEYQKDGWTALKDGTAAAQVCLAFDTINGESLPHCAVLTWDGFILDFTLRQFFDDAPYPCVMSVFMYQQFVGQRGAKPGNREYAGGGTGQQFMVRRA